MLYRYITKSFSYTFAFVYILLSSKAAIMSVFALPFELWTKIFRIVDDNRDLRNCMLVCKFWQDIALSLLGHDFSIKLTDSQLDLLAKDLEDYPSIAKKTSRITIIEGPSSPTASAQFMAVVNACSGPLELHFDTMHIYQYLVMLYCTRSVVPDIQRIYIPEIEASYKLARWHTIFSFDAFEMIPPDTIQLYLKVNYRLRTTITSIYVIFDDINYNESLEDYGGLIRYVASFPLLQCLVVKVPYPKLQDNTIELPQLLNQSSRLTSLELHGISYVRATEFLDERGPLPLNDLKLSGVTIDVNLLNYIMSRLKNLSYVQLVLRNILSSPLLTESESNSQVEKFNKYAKTIQYRNIYYIYKGEEFSVDDEANLQFDESICDDCVELWEEQNPIDIAIDNIVAIGDDSLMAAAYHDFCRRFDESRSSTDL